jgi:2-polyprenyl-3-methyl-5-hydroxy-6-metoxy-1,4-benzoquinol methylase
LTEHRLFDPAAPPAWLDSRWWTETPNCNHLDGETAFAHRPRLEAAAKSAVRCAELAGTQQIVDVGAGDGGLLSLLPEPYRSLSYGYEIITDSVRHAGEVRGVEVRRADVLRDELALGPVVTATEMLEHLDDPHGFVKRLYESPDTRFMVASSPQFETPEVHCDNHAWAWDMAGYEAMFVAAGWNVVENSTVDWYQVLTVTKE